MVAHTSFLIFFIFKGKRIMNSETWLTERSNPMLCSSPLCVVLFQQLNCLVSDVPSKAVGGFAQVN